MVDNAVDCDLHRAELVYKEDPLKSLNIYKFAAKKLTDIRQFLLAKPIIYKIVLITGSLYDVKKAMAVSSSYASMNRVLASNLDLRRLAVFLEALNHGDRILADNAIEETRDPWAKDIMIKMKKEQFLLDGGGDDEIDLR